VTGYEELGPVAGADGPVRARRLSDGAEVVLKRLPKAGSEDWLKQAARRTETLARIGHPALPRIFEVTLEESALVIVMEYAPGGSLADHLAGGKMPPGVVAELFSTLGEGLEVAHQAGILHLDLKPSNVLFRSNGDAFLSDFGHNRLLETTGQPTPGTAEYLDPAVAEGGPPDAMADVYALAALSYQALTGRPPFSGESVVEVAEAVRSGVLRPLTPLVGGLPVPLADAVERALQRRREQRYPSAAAFAEALLPGQAPLRAASEPGEVRSPLEPGEVRSRLEPGEVRSPLEPLGPGKPALAPPPAEVLAASEPDEVLPPLPPPEAVAVPWMPAPEELQPGRRPRTIGWRPVATAAFAAIALVAVLVVGSPLLRGTGSHGKATTHLLVGPSPDPAKTSPAPDDVTAVGTPTATSSGADSAVTSSAQPVPPSPSPGPSTSPRPAAALARPRASAAPRPTVPPPAPSSNPIPPPPLPPKGQRIAFTGTKDGRPSIYVTDPTGKIVVRVTNSPVGADSQPVWSPDGTRIAFTSTRDGSRQIYVMNADGSNQYRLTAGTANNYDPAWDPNGAAIAYVTDQTGSPQVYMIGALGGTGQYAGPLPAQDYAASRFAQPAFSPDGQMLAATVLLSGTVIVTWRVFGPLVAGLNMPPVPQVQNPAWSPGGTQIVYGSSDTRSQVWVMASDGSGKKALTADPSNNSEPRFSPAGDRIVFVSDRAGLRQVWAMQPDGSQQALVVNVAGETYDPAWG
jgi:Tol biopolymer transport system component